MPTLESYRKRQISAGILALGIVVIILVLPYGFAGLPAYLNKTFADPDHKYVELDTWDIDGDKQVDGKSYYYWYNSSGALHRNNVTIVSGVLTVQDRTVIDGNISTDKGDPYYVVYWKGYTAKDALDDGLVKIRLVINGLTPSEAHTITFYAGDVVLFTKTISENEAIESINETFDVDVRDLMDAVIAHPDDAYFMLKITNEPNYNTVSIKDSAAYRYNTNNPVTLGTTLTVGGMLTAIVCFVAALFALPQYGLPNFNVVGKIGKRRR